MDSDSGELLKFWEPGSVWAKPLGASGSLWQPLEIWGLWADSDSGELLGAWECLGQASGSLWEPLAASGNLGPLGTVSGFLLKPLGASRGQTGPFHALDPWPGSADLPKVLNFWRAFRCFLLLNGEEAFDKVAPWPTHLKPL